MARGWPRAARGITGSAGLGVRIPSQCKMQDETQDGRVAFGSAGPHGQREPLQAASLALVPLSPQRSATCRASEPKAEDPAEREEVHK